MSKARSGSFPHQSRSRNKAARHLWNYKLNPATRLSLFRGLRVAELLDNKWNLPDSAKDIEKFKFDELEPELQIILIEQLVEKEDGELIFPEELYFRYLERPEGLKRKEAS